MGIAARLELTLRAACAPRRALQAKHQQASSFYGAISFTLFWNIKGVIMQATHFSYMPSSSPSDTPRIRAFGMEESTAVASPMRLAKQRLHRPVSPEDCSMEDIMSFVRDKVSLLTQPDVPFELLCMGI